VVIRLVRSFVEVVAFAGVVVFVATVAFAPRRSDACSVAATYIAPTNVELVASSPRIVIATATSKTTGSGIDELVTMRIERVVRGRGVKVGDELSVRGSLAGYMGASPKLDFSKPRRGAFAGGCTAWDYRIGSSYVLLLEQFGGVWHTRGVPFARVNEEVDDENAPWAVAVREYARIADLRTAVDRRKALEALVARGAAAQATPTERAIADDVRAHFVAPTPAKPFAELAALEQAGTANHASALLAIGVGADPAARKYMRDVVADLRAGTANLDRLALEAVAAYYDKVADPAVVGQLAELYVQLGSTRKQERWPLMWLLIHRADASHRSVMEQALLGTDDEEAGRLAAWFVRFPSAVAEQDVIRRLGGVFGAGGSSAHSDMVMELAGMGNKAVLAWAKTELARSPTANDQDRWVALYSIARSPLREADALVPSIIARGGDDLMNLVQGYEEARHTRADVRLAQIAKRKGLDAEVREWTTRTIDARKAGP
jgi:hypothetical protein